MNGKLEGGLLYSYRYIRSTMPLDDLELRARYPPVDEMGRPLALKVIPKLGELTILN
jgi:Choline sulfatase enzyme C terminal